MSRLLYQYLNRQWEANITALYLADYSMRGGADRGFGRRVQWDIDLLEGYDARFVRGAERRGEPARFLSIIAPRLWRDIRSGGFAALIVHGHTPAAMVLAAAAAKASRIPVLMRCETHLGLRRSGLKRLLTAAVDRLALPAVRCRSGDRVGQSRVLPSDGSSGGQDLYDALCRR